MRFEPWRLRLALKLVLQLALINADRDLGRRVD